MIRAIIGLVLSVTAFYLLGGFGKSEEDEKIAASTKYCIENMGQKYVDKFGVTAVQADCARAAKESVTGITSSAPWNIPRPADIKW